MNARQAKKILKKGGLSKSRVKAASGRDALGKILSVCARKKGLRKGFWIAIKAGISRDFAEVQLLKWRRVGR